jgi:hypothetical protein
MDTEKRAEIFNQMKKYADTKASRKDELKKKLLDIREKGEVLETEDLPVQENLEGVPDQEIPEQSTPTSTKPEQPKPTSIKPTPAPTQTKPKKSDEEIIFSDFEIDGFVIRPWTLGKLKRINPHLEAIFGALEQKNIKVSLDNLEMHISDLYFAAIPQIISILAISLDKDEDELEEIPIPQAIKLIFCVYKQNEEAIKNVLNLLQVTRI